MQGWSRFPHATGDHLGRFITDGHANDSGLLLRVRGFGGFELGAEQGCGEEMGVLCLAVFQAALEDVRRDVEPGDHHLAADDARFVDVGAEAVACPAAQARAGNDHAFAASTPGDHAPDDPLGPILAVFIGEGGTAFHALDRGAAVVIVGVNHRQTEFPADVFGDDAFTGAARPGDDECIPAVSDEEFGHGEEWKMKDGKWKMEKLEIQKRNSRMVESFRLGKSAERGAIEGQQAENGLNSKSLPSTIPLTVLH